MAENRNYYVYGYVREDYESYFYIGKGTDYRYKETYGRSKYFNNITKNTKTYVVKIFEDLTEYEALELEKYAINYLIEHENYSIEIQGYKKNKGKHLVNKTLGGEGISGYRHNKENICKMMRLGANNGMFGRTGDKCPSFGLVRSEETKEKIRNMNPRSKRVRCIELDEIFDSYRHAESELLKKYNIVCSHASISAICRGRNKKGGYYLDTKEPTNLHFEFIEFARTTTERKGATETILFNSSDATV